jgi:hypothetical protein
LLNRRNLVCLTLITVLPASLIAQDQAAMLHSDGSVQLNGAAAPPSTAIFPGDLIVTQAGALAKIDVTGSTATVQPSTQVRFEGNDLFLEHGAVQVTTFTSMRVRVGCLTVVPVKNEATQYDVTDVDGRVTVHAAKSDVRIESRGGSLAQSRKSGRSESFIVHETEQKTRDEGCAVAAKPTDAIGGAGAILNSTWAKYGGMAVVGVLTCWALCRGDNPVSPDSPTK